MLTMLMGSFIILLFLGLPVTFILGGLGVIFGLLFWGFGCIQLISDILLDTMTNQILLAVPLFVFMGSMIQFAGVGENFYKAMHYWMGNLRGGLAIGTTFSLTAIAAMAPSGVGTLIMGTVALPNMIKRKYDLRLALGTVIAGGMLGMLIVPSIMIILYAMVAGESVGKMFMGAFIPGLLMAFLFAAQIAIRCYRNPELGPPIDEKADWKYKFSLLKGILFPVALIIVILGGIYSGLWTPTEASGVGAVGAIAAAAIHRKLDWEVLKDSSYNTLTLCGMIFWLVAAVKLFSSVFAVSGASEYIHTSITALTLSPWAIIIGMQLSLFVLCMFVDDFAIMLLVTPIYVPIVKALGFDTLWFGILFIINMNIAWITPPYGFNLFYGRAIAPEGVTMRDIYLSVIPFILCQIICLALVMIFPQLALWIPSLMK
jgi:tripartite ATP-independent transporter DctM subunit